MPIFPDRHAVSVVMPAYRAEHTIVAAVRSVIAQTVHDWELLIVADDHTDYETLLGRSGIIDRRIRFFATGKIGSGSPPARNIGIDNARFRYSAILDADDQFHPEKLARALPALDDFGIVSTALQLTDADGRPLRRVGEGPDRPLLAQDYKFINLSMDSMLVYDRNKADPRFNSEFPCLTDIEFLLRLLAHNAAVFHLGTPLHTYSKQPASISNKPGASARIAETKRRILSLLAAGAYPLADPDGTKGMTCFYEISLRAEESYGRQLLENPGLLFEDHLEPMLAAHQNQIILL